MPTEKETIFIEKYTEHGDGVKACKQAGYTGNNLQSQASRLKRKLSTQIDEQLRQQLGDDSVIMFNIIKSLAMSAQSEQVKYKAASDWLDRAGYKPIEETRDVSEKTNPIQRYLTLVDKIGEIDAARLFPDIAKQAAKH